MYIIYAAVTRMMIRKCYKDNSMMTLKLTRYSSEEYVISRSSQLRAKQFTRTIAEGIASQLRNFRNRWTNFGEVLLLAREKDDGHACDFAMWIPSRSVTICLIVTTWHAYKYRITITAPLQVHMLIRKYLRTLIRSSFGAGAGAHICILQLRPSHVLELSQIWNRNNETFMKI